MKLTRENFGQLLTPVHKKVFYNAYDEKPEQYSKVFSVDKMNKKQETFPHMGSFGLWGTNTEGNTINEDKMTQGNTATMTAVRYDKGYELTWELIQDDLYNVMKGIGKGGSAKALGRGLRATIETKCAEVLSNGYTNTGYDGKALFADDHPLADSASTGDNLYTGSDSGAAKWIIQDDSIDNLVFLWREKAIFDSEKIPKTVDYFMYGYARWAQGYVDWRGLVGAKDANLTDANLKTALKLMRGQVDEANVKIQAVAKNLIVTADNEFTAAALIKSAQQAGTPNNDTNTLPKLNIVVMDYLS